MGELPALVTLCDDVEGAFLRPSAGTASVDGLDLYKAPAAVEFVKEFPKSATGKILKRVLRAS